MQRLGGGLLFAATTAITTLVVVACATGTESGGGDFGEGGLEDAARDGSVIPVPKDGAVPDDSGTPDEDSGPGCTQKVVINEVMTDGTTANDEMIELYNPSTCAVPIGNWTLKYSSAGGSAPSTLHTFSSGDSVPSKGFLVLTAGGSPSLTPGMAKSDGQVGLLDDTGKIIDAVAYGTVTSGMFREGTSASSPASGGSIGRSPNGGDTNNNKTDFKTYGSPSPDSANP